MVTGVTSDVGVSSTYLVIYDSGVCQGNLMGALSLAFLRKS